MMIMLTAVQQVHSKRGSDVHEAADPEKFDVFVGLIKFKYV